MIHPPSLMTTAAIGPAVSIPWGIIAAITVAVIGFAGSVAGAVLAYRATRAATAMTTQTAAQTATLGSMDTRLQATLDGKDALIDDLREERNDLRTQLTEIRANVTALEGSFSAFRDQAFAEIRDLRNEVGDLRSSDTQWKRWAGMVLGMYATVAEKLRMATGEGSPDLPPSPPLT
jgi:hypothetical protein